MARPIGKTNARRKLGKNGKKTNVKPTPIIRGKHPKGNPPAIGTIERLDEKIIRAHRLKAEGNYHYQIAQHIAKEFDCDPPALSTVSKWLDTWHDAFFSEIKDVQKKIREDQYWRLEHMLHTTLPLAHGHFVVQRHVKQDGQEVLIIDEQVMDEKIKNGMLSVKIMERQAKLMGADLQIEKDADGKTRTPAEMFLYFQQCIVNPPQQQPGEQPLEVLEITSGDADKI